MLKGVPAILPPELLKILCEMGHGDEITIGDANFPGASLCPRVIRMDGHGVPEILDAILQLIPMDQYVEHPAALMQVVPGDKTETPIWEVYKEILARHEDRGADCLEEVERFAFYDRVREKSYAVIMSGEKATYANIILKKGVIK
ncbi:MAG: RbsD/FucU family protein [Aristaeellaceae bacterium]